MKGMLRLFRAPAGLRDNTGPCAPPEPDSRFFSTAFAASAYMDGPQASWLERAQEVEAVPHPQVHTATQRMQQLWMQDRHMAPLGEAAIRRMLPFFAYVCIAPGHTVIRQQELGDFMLITLTGSLAVDRLLPWGESRRLAETQPGDMLGEMSLIDGGARFSSCTTLTGCEAAVLSAPMLDQMVEREPALAARLVATLARKLSRQLRAVSARLDEHPSP